MVQAEQRSGVWILKPGVGLVGVFPLRSDGVIIDGIERGVR